MLFSETHRLLELVSRSFALCIPKLPEKVRGEVGNFYLLCRYADSIEDSALALRKKRVYFLRYIRALKKNDIEAIRALGTEILPWVEKENDKKLVEGFEAVFLAFEAFDKKSRRIGIRWLREMAKGMLKYSKKEIQSFFDLDNYCYYVAGTVGMYVTEILDHKFKLHKYHELKARAKDFGLLLQKVNIIKDFARDLSEGRIYWPTELLKKYSLEKGELLGDTKLEEKRRMLSEMVNSAEKNIQSSIEYLERLPRDLQLACAIPFFMAIPTLLKCYGNEEIFDATKNVKISREETFSIIWTIEKNAGKQEFPKNYFSNLNKKNKRGLSLQV